MTCFEWSLLSENCLIGNWLKSLNLIGDASRWEANCSEEAICRQITARRNWIPFWSEAHHKHTTQEPRPPSWLLLRWSSKASGLWIHEEQEFGPSNIWYISLHSSHYIVFNSLFTSSQVIIYSWSFLILWCLFQEKVMSSWIGTLGSK